MGQDLSRDLFALLYDVARLNRAQADKRARVHGMTLAQWGLLLRLDRNPGLSQKEIADLLEVEPITVARLVDRLEAAGMVERRPDLADRRIWRLHLCRAAKNLLAEIEAQRAEMAAIVTQGMTPEMRNAMVEALLLMKANLLRPELAEQEKETA